MLRKWGGHIRHNVVSYLALFVAMTGTAYAAGPLKAGDPASGDLTGVYPDPRIKSCQSSGQILKWNGTTWVCAVDDSATVTPGRGMEQSASGIGLISSCQTFDVLRYDATTGTWGCAPAAFPTSP